MLITTTNGHHPNETIPSGDPLERPPIDLPVGLDALERIRRVKAAGYRYIRMPWAGTTRTPWYVCVHKDDIDDLIASLQAAK